MEIALPVLNAEGALARIENDIELYQELISDFFTVEKNTAAEMQALYNARNYEQLRARAHRSKGALLTLGAEKLAGTSRNIELMIKENRIDDRELALLIDRFTAGLTETTKALAAFMSAHS